MRPLIPLLGNQQDDRSRPDVERSVDHPFGMRSDNRDLNLFATPPITTIQGGYLGDNGFIEHHNNGVFACAQTPVEPPFARRQWGDRRANR